MPSRERVERLIELVEAGSTVQAIEELYAEDASMQENGGPLRIGRATLIEHERAMLAQFAEVRAVPTRPAFFVEGDQVVVHWVFEMTDRRGRTRRLDELSLQEWRGDRIVRERFYYDSRALTG